MSESSNLSPEHQAAKKIAAARAARTLVDHNGQPIGEEASVFEYDERGILVKATPGKAAE